MKVGAILRTFPHPSRLSPSSRTPRLQVSSKIGTISPTTASKGGGIHACSVYANRIPNGVPSPPCASKVGKGLESGGIFRPSPPPCIARLATGWTTASGTDQSAPFSACDFLNGQPSMTTDDHTSSRGTERTSVLQSLSWNATTTEILSRGGLASPTGDVVGDCPRYNRKSLHRIHRHGRRVSCGVVNLNNCRSNSIEPYLLLDTMEYHT